MHHHPADLSGRVQRWRAAPEALPAIIRRHHTATPPARPAIQPIARPPRDDQPSPALLGVIAAFAAWVIFCVACALYAGGRF
ncbi:hypothetical protein [Sphingomonas sp.]|uniref:hypothetical protein n=1 Tax=Sphingomonas sp. TaxID=28214 RepID=UPI0031D11112